MSAGTFRCGHQKSPENTLIHASSPRGRCRCCHDTGRDQWQRDNYRRRYLPGQIEATFRKLAMLRNEAGRLGMKDILSDPRYVNAAWDMVIDEARGVNDGGSV